MQTTSQPSVITSVSTSTSQMRVPDHLEFLRSIASSASGVNDAVAKGLEAIAHALGAPYISIKIDIDGVPNEWDFHCGDTPMETWRQLCSLSMLECLSTQSNQASFFVERTTGVKTAVLAVPTNSLNPSAVGAACLVVPTENADAANRSQKRFELMLSVLIGSLQQHARGSAGEASQTSASSRPSGDTSRDANFLTRICNGKIWEDQTAFAYQLVNGLCNQLKCLDVSFGSVRNKRVKLLAISGYDSINSRSPGSVAIEQAMTEALDAGHWILVQSDPSASPVQESLNCVLHRAMRTKSGNCSCFSFPLIHDDEVVAVCTLRRDENQPFSSDEIELLQSHHARLAEYVAISGRLSQSFLSSLGEQISNKFSKKNRWGAGRKMCAAAVLGALGLCLFLPWPHSISIPCSLVSAETRTFSAPFTGKLSQVHVRNGDWVSQGALLYEMDTAELRNQRSKLEAEWKSKNQAMIRLLQSDETAKAGEQKYSMLAIRKELALIDSKINQAIVRAEESGTIVESDLHQRVGETIAIGERMFNFAPSNSHQVELRIPDYLGMEFQAGQQGRFATSAEPGKWRDVVLQRVDMSSTTENGENFIKAIGTSSQFDDQARFGLTGFACISVGNQPGWWILLQQPIRYIQRKVSQL
jgi:hypothetical protein